MRVIRPFTAVLCAAAGCSDLGPGSGPGPAPPEAIVSNPMPGLSFGVGGSAPAGTVAFVSLPPGSVPLAMSALVENRRSGASVQVAMVGGGFDPVPVPAEVGDTIAIEPRRADGQALDVISMVVPPRRAPTIVRILPPPGRRDVPLNASVVVVFSEPIDVGSITEASLALRSPSAPVAGTRRVTDQAGTTVTLIPSRPLAPSTAYDVSVSDAVRDQDGDRLDAATHSSFTTASLTALTATVSFQSCVAPSTPIQVWYQDGNGPWSQLESGPDRDYVFTLSNSRAAIAFAVGGPWGTLEFIFATSEELGGLRICSPAPLKGATTTGTVTGLAEGQEAVVNLGSGYTRVSGGGPVAFSLRGTRGVNTLLAMRNQLEAYEGGYTLSNTLDSDRMVIDRAFVSGSTVGFASAAAFEPASGVVQVTGTGPNDETQLQVQFGNADGAAPVFNRLNWPQTGMIKGIPLDRQNPGELHTVQATVSRRDSSGPAVRTAIAYRRDVTSSLTLQIGPEISVAFQELASAPLRRFRCTIPEIPEYARYVTCARAYKGGYGISLSATSGWRPSGQTGWVLTVPDFSAFASAYWGSNSTGADFRDVYMTGFEGPGRIDLSVGGLAPVAQDGRSWRYAKRYDIQP